MGNLPKAVVEAVQSVIGKDPQPLHRPFVDERDMSNVRFAMINPVGYEWINRFEALLATRTGRKFAVMTSSGTAALHLALLALGVRRNVEVMIPPLTFAGAAAAAVYCGAEIQFWPIQGHAGIGMAVDLLGFPSPELNICTIEDAAEALGSTLEGKPCGSFGKVSILSFNNNKIVTTGGGGAVVTDDEEIAKTVRHLATTAKVPSDVDFIHNAVGFNYRPTELGAALGYGQLVRLDQILERKRALHDRYIRAIMQAGFDGEVRVLHPAKDASSPNYWLNALIVPPADLLPILDAMRAAGIGARRLFYPLPLLEPYRNYVASSFLLERAKLDYDTTILLPSGNLR